MGERLSAGNTAVALLANSVATGAALIAIILTLGPVSGAHLNPVVTVSEAWTGNLSWRNVPGYLAAQVFGAFAGVAIANVMFGESIYSASQHTRNGLPLALSECVATCGLLITIRGTAHSRPSAVPYAVGAYITGAYWFTSSTSFANPAVTIARAATDTFAGIRPADVPMFIAAQAVGAVLAILLSRWLFSSSG